MRIRTVRLLLSCVRTVVALYVSTNSHKDGSAGRASYRGIGFPRMRRAFPSSQNYTIPSTKYYATTADSRHEFSLSIFSRTSKVFSSIYDYEHTGTRVARVKCRLTRVFERKKKRQNLVETNAREYETRASKK